MGLRASRWGCEEVAANVQRGPGDARILAVVVVHDGEQWLDACLDGLEAQTHPELSVLAVDNGSTDGSRAILTRRLGEDRVLVAERDLGFGAAVSMALDAAASSDAEQVLFVHDDLVLAPEAVELLSRHLSADPRVAVVGAKLVDLDRPDRLQSVGMSVDVTGRADGGIEEDELDQGQRDHVQRPLYVSTGGMLVRRDAFEDLGRFDRRYHLFRDDLDLCWRAWLRGYDVEVVPSAVGRHVASASNYGRLGQTAFLGPRYFAERNTLATLLKNYGAPRLLYVVPLYFLVGVAKVMGFVATRRVGDAWQTVRAWVWNLLHLRETWRLRRQVQSRRQRTDSELAPLFLRVGARLRAYAEAIGDWVAGGDLTFEEPPPASEVPEPRTATERVISLVARRPVAVTAAVLFVIGIVVSLPLLRPGLLRGGELAPWPLDTGRFLGAYVDAWHGVGSLGGPTAPSPAQALLGVISAVALGSAWLAPRLLLLAAVPLAWILALRAGRLVSNRRLPRLAAATAYALSPPMIAALRSGQVGPLVVGVCLPALAVTLGTAVRTDLSGRRTWRNTSAAAIVAAVAAAFEPLVLIALLLFLVQAVAVAVGIDASRSARRGIVIRLLAFGGGTLLLLFPWVLELIRTPARIMASPTVIGSEPRAFWRWLLQAPDLPGFTGMTVGIGLVAAGVLGLAFGFARRPLAVTSLWSLALAGVFAAWGLGRAGSGAWAWAGLPLLLTSLAFAGLLAVAFSSAEAQLGEHDFGWRQLAGIATALVVATGIAASIVTVTTSPWDSYAVGEDPMPAFIATEAEVVGPFRVLVLAEQQGALTWDLTGPEGPTMVSYGQEPPQALTNRVQRALLDMFGGSDPGAAGRLGVANVRYVFVPEPGRSDRIGDALEDQFGLEPRPVATGQLFLVSDWLPRATVVPPDVALSVARRGELPSRAEVTPLQPSAATRYEGAAPDGGIVLLAEAADGDWQVTADGRRVQGQEQAGLVRFDLPGPAGEVVVRHAGQASRTAAVLLQLLFLFTAVSLMLRPPGFATEGSGDPSRRGTR